MKRIEEIQIGSKAELRHVISAEDVERFIDLTGDDNKLHADEDFASRTEFKKPNVHGMLSAAFISTMIGTKLPGDGALCVSQQLDFLLPVNVGDEITVKGEVIKKNDALNLITLQTEMYNQHKQKVISGKFDVKLVNEQPLTEQAAEKQSKPKVVLVTGGAGSVGSATCLQCAQAGYRVVIHYYRHKEEAVRLSDRIAAAGGQAYPVYADLNNEQDIRELVEKTIRHYGTISALVNCAALPVVPVKYALLAWEDLQKQLDCYVKYAFNLTRLLVPLMEQAGYGKLVFLTTGNLDAPASELIPFVTAKAALAGFAKSLAVELAPKGIRVNLVAPGMAESNAYTGYPLKNKLVAASKTPLGRLALPEDIAGAISFLVSETSDYLTGETIRVNGGNFML